MAMMFTCWRFSDIPEGEKFRGTNFDPIMNEFTSEKYFEEIQFFSRYFVYVFVTIERLCNEN